MSSTLQQRLLDTLNVLQASEKASDEVKQEALKPGVDYNEATGEWYGEQPEGYRPIVEPPSLEKIENKDSKVPEYEQSDVTADYRRVRDTSYALQEATLFMITQAAKLAVETEAPRAFTVFRELGELMRGLNKDIMENQKTYREVTKGVEPPQTDETTVEVTTNPDGSVKMSVGKQARSSRDLLKMIEEAQRNKEERKKAAQQPEEIIDVEPDVKETSQEEVKEEDDGGKSEA
ncbi:hypothetical protein DEEACLCL_00029 [Salmonella phage CRW-SP2]|nr:hypothetical protein DEEACLCL_00029 [Salmonella phage CRW-SP2]